MYTNTQVRSSTKDGVPSDEVWQSILNRTVAIGLISLVLVLGLGLVLGKISHIGVYEKLLIISLFMSCGLPLFWRLTTDTRESEQTPQFSPPAPNFLLNWGRILLIWGILLAIFSLLIKFTESSVESYTEKGITLHLSTNLLLCWVFIVPLVVYIMHPTLVFALTSLQSARQVSKKTVIAGANPLSEHLESQIKKLGNLHLQFQGYFDDWDDERSAEDTAASEKSLLGSLEQLPTYVKDNQVQVVYIALPSRQEAKIKWLLERLQDTTACVYLIPNLPTLATLGLPSLDLRQTKIYGINGVPALALWEIPFSSLQSALKRSLDVCLSGLALFVLSPVMLLIALGVRLTSPGPALFKQRRHGFNGQEILIYKFRSMRVMENGDAVVQAKRNDSRVTTLGAFLRRTSLDELPQFINVLQGRMSVVGPRPHAIAHNEQYRKLIGGYMLRHKVKPGITGWAQVNGLRGETDTLDKMKQRVDYDLYYLKNWSLGLDLQIILRTALVFFQTKSVY
ncbi:MAG: undecaprenyl-phosphate glucose phosphotransferase [Aphanocapsa sp. GSE-SYN-MK-11-07L]|jgi:putative colanic acid biosynthesis UDP-glucose lipid carrier transferase|nr:undecaprenyl-phosphate glucose phosphotransferase [Aphanocapsa sp. GSE-SYN-MK-11-07L]